MKKIISLSIIALVCFSSCKDDTSAPPVPLPQKRVIISNEGQFNAGNASVSIYYPNGDSVQNNVYEQVNGLAMGDVLQSLKIDGDRIYGVVNNSGKVEVINRDDFTAVTFIDGLTSPRYILPISPTKAYVSDLFGDMGVINPTAESLASTIPTNGVMTGRMLLNGSEAYVCFEGASSVKVFDTMTDTEVHSYDIGRTPVDIVEDAEGMIWMLSSGAYFDFVAYEFFQEQPHLVRVDPSTKEVLLDYLFDDWNAVQDMEIASNGQSIVVLKANEIWTMGIGDSTLVELPGSEVDGNFYGQIGVDPENDDIYLANAGDFQSPGLIQQYSANGTFLKEFSVGVAPNGVVFD